MGSSGFFETLIREPRISTTWFGRGPPTSMFRRAELARSADNSQLEQLALRQTDARRCGPRFRDPTYIVSEFAAQNVKVVLTGDGRGGVTWPNGSRQLNTAS